MFKGCEMVEKNLCAGCTGLAEKDWVGKFKCPIYHELKDRSGLELCKKILRGE